MHNEMEKAPSGREVFWRGLLRENPILMQSLGLFPAVALAGSLKSAVIVALAAALILIVMELLTALLFKRLPFWLRIGLYVLLSYGMLAGGMAACDRFFPNLLGSLSGYLPLLAVNALTVYRCETCAARNRLGTSLLDAAGASLGYGAVLLLIGLLRELLGAGTIWGRPVFAGPMATGLLMPFGGFLLLGFLAAAVKWLYNRRHQGEEELETPVAHVDEEDGSVMEPLIRLFHRGRAVKAVPAQQAEKDKALEQQRLAKQAAQQKAREEKRQALERKRLAKEDAAKRAQAEKDKALEEQRLAKQAAQQKTRGEKSKSPAHQPEKAGPVNRQASDPPSGGKEAARPKNAGKTFHPGRTARNAQTNVPTDLVRAQQEEELESFAEVLEALNRRREREKAAGEQEQKGEDQP
ncbi:MAG TPA: hypothetical protein IAD07_06765 [Candidatus Fimivicinus intestinavium]|nr:hypothetical protein [Candidatus Fimivicinus intestinavium]